MWRLWILGVIVTLSIGLGALTFSPKPSSHAQDGESDEPLVVLNEDNIKQATVLVMQVSDQSGKPVITCLGSGTLVSSDGLILTNAHLVTPSADCLSNRIVIGLTLSIGEPPVPTYVADVLEINTGYDLAVLRIRNYLDGRAIEPGTLQLPFVELGNSSQVGLDETIYIFGYPDLENKVVEVRRTPISGFTAEARVGERAWLRVAPDNPLPGLMSGGGAYNRDGELIGIPTILPARVAGAVVDCRQVYDTNGNNTIDNNDGCIPIGGAITAIRPSQLARGLVQAAAFGIRRGTQRVIFEEPPLDTDPEFRNLFIATSVNPADMPTTVLQAVPTGTSDLYLFFDYHNMEDGLIYELRTTINGRPNPIYSLPPVAWNGGREGLWYIGSTNVLWPPGQHEFTLFIEGRQIASLSFNVGDATSTTAPQFSDLTFGIENSLGELVGANYVVPEGNIIRARFNYRNMTPGIIWGFQWYFNSQALSGEGASGTTRWENDTSQGTLTDLAIRSETGFVSGRYRLELYIQEGENQRLTALSDFIVAGGAGGANDAEAQVFGDFRFAQGEQGNTPINVVIEEVPTNPTAIYIFFNWRQISRGTPWTWRWLLDNDILIEENTYWAAEGTGENFFLSLVGSPTLPDATYTLEVELNGILFTEEVAIDVGLGQLPVESFASAEGIRMNGRILDAETGQGIPGAMFIVLQSDFSVEDWTWDNSQVLGRAQADENGFFQIPILLPRGTTETPILYSVLVRASGYFPASVDGITVTNETRSPLEIEVRMNRD